ncbi:hypothetical protein [Proteus columbae]|uniref:hypothetical protein n=1 Tax=Proteus columbae TaxID=1987580 RepID=UPI00288AFF9A|nr:hypothetical protein [Proteus columbae]
MKTGFFSVTSISTTDAKELISKMQSGFSIPDISITHGKRANGRYLTISTDHKGKPVEYATRIPLLLRENYLPGGVSDGYNLEGLQMSVHWEHAGSKIVVMYRRLNGDDSVIGENLLLTLPLTNVLRARHLTLKIGSEHD